MISEILCRASVCVAICVVVVVSGGATNVNDFEPTIKFLSSAADPKTPLALPYFLAGELRQTDGDSTPKSTSTKRPTQPLKSTKTRHVSKIIDLTGSPTTIYIKNNRGRDYHRENHESPPPVPTRPIYPGPGQWSQRGIKHQPYIYGIPYSNGPTLPINGPPNGNFKKYKENYHNQNVQHKHHKHKSNHHHHGHKHKPSGTIQNHKPQYSLNNYHVPKTQSKPKKTFKNPAKQKKYNEHTGDKQIELIHKEKPYEKDGIEIFDRQHNYFQSRFPERINAPEPDPHPTQQTNAKTKNHDHDDKEEFVPTRMYAQVRQYETESHLPASIEEPNLKKLVKDSRIHTVYMEEGYEDGAYDHAGEEKHAEEDESHFEHEEKRKRRKRRSIDPSLTNFEIDTDFIGKTKFSVGEHVIEGSNKYPYYNKKDINHNSPLRYAQDLNDIPKKKGGNMAFYEESEARTRCDNIVDKVNPIPKDLENAKETPEKTMMPPLPRLKNLGDKLDCFKVRYFGEDPLDSPLFKEELVGQPEDPFVKEFHKPSPLRYFNRSGKSYRPIANANMGEFKYTQTSQSEVNEEIQDPSESEVVKVHGGLQEVPPPSNLANSFQEDMQPMIKLVKINEPVEELMEEVVTKNSTNDEVNYPLNEMFDIEKNMETTTISSIPITKIPPKETVIASASGVAVAHLNAALEAQVKGIVDESQSNDNDTVAASSIAEDAIQTLPEAEALRMRRLTRRRKRPYHHNKLHVGRYAYRSSNKPPPPIIYPRGTTTNVPPLAFPAQNTISEVYYKDQIKPNEQLNVFADVINHIQNMSRDDAYSAASDHHAQVLPSTRPGSINTKLRNTSRKKKRKYPVMKTTQQLYNEYVRRSKNNPRNPDEVQITQETKVGTVKFSKPATIDFYNNGETPVYTTIDVPMNKFLVPGMKPPLAHEKPMIYSDYQTDNILKRQDWFTNHRLSRRKRGTRNYSEIRRQPVRKQQDPVEEEEDDDDDYVPHRPTNYHYDPETDRIIYDRKPTTESIEAFIDAYLKEDPEDEPDQDDDEEEEEKEPQEDKPATTTLKTIPHRTVYHKDVLNPENGKTLVDYLMILRSHPSYKYIPDPTTTEKPKPTTTQKPPSTTPPAFINFLQKLHNMEGYKRYEEEDSKKKKPTTTTAVPIEEIEKEEENASAQVSVQNAPGGQFYQDSTLQIFDINEYLPKVKSYTPRTSIDYSKYKTIERTPSRHNLSSRYSEEEDDLPLTRSKEQPVATKYQTAPPRPKTPPPKEKIDEKDENEDAEQQQEEEETKNLKEENTTTTTTKTTTTTTTTSAPKIRIRGRGRPTRRPQTTTKSTRTTEANEVTEEAAVYTPATHRPPSRVYPRRQRPKIRLRSTTTSAPTETQVEDDSRGHNHDQPQAKQLKQKEQKHREDKDLDSEDDEPTEAQTQRRAIRRLGKVVPANHKPAYTPVTISKRMDDHPIILVQRQPRLVTPEIINYNRTGGVSRPGEINPRKIAILRKGARYMGNAVDDSSKTLINDGVLDSYSNREDEKHGKDTEKLPAIGDDSEVSKKNSGSNSATVKFIKDPNKRLYFYAPL